MQTYRIVVDNVPYLGKNLTVFSGVNEKNLRVRCVTKLKLLPTAGEVYDVTGEWENNEKYGKQLITEQIYRRRLSGKLIIPFLINTISGVGPERAKKLFDTFGDEFRNVIFSPNGMEQIAAVLNPQMTPFAITTAAYICESFKTRNTEFETLEWLESKGITDYSTGRKVARILGDKAMQILQANPYVLSTVMKWPKIDKIGLAILKARDDVQRPRIAAERLIGAIDSVMRDQIDLGNTAILKKDLPRLLSKKLGLTDAEVQMAIELGRSRGAIIDGYEIWRAPGCAFMEDDIRKRFLGMINADESSQVDVPDTVNLSQYLSELYKRLGTLLHEEQFTAVIKVLGGQLRVLRGGAGTGKTTVIRAIAQAWISMGGRVEIATLAGKAALRASQSTGMLARTIFRLLKSINGDQRFFPMEDLPVLDSRTLLIVDEASMVDLGQWHQLHLAMQSGCRLLMVGDPDQLPPIGFGLVFHVLAEVPEITASLTKIHRQKDDSGIPEAACAIRDRKLPNFLEFLGLAPGVSFVEVPTDKIPAAIERIVTDLGGFNPSNDIMVCTALNRSEIGVDGLNELFSSRQGASVEADSVKGFYGQWYLPNDPVIYLKNDYREGLFNGSLGRVTAVYPRERKITAIFDGEEKTFAGEELLKLKLAYAITCHKAQGSEAKRVVIPIADTQLLDPSWLYTAVTRAKAQCVMVGEMKMLAEILKRPASCERRLVGFTI